MMKRTGGENMRYRKPGLVDLTGGRSLAHCGNGSGATYDHTCLSGTTIEDPNCAMGSATISICETGTGAKDFCDFGGAVSLPCSVGTHPTHS